MTRLARCPAVPTSTRLEHHASAALLADWSIIGAEQKQEPSDWPEKSADDRVANGILISRARDDDPNQSADEGPENPDCLFVHAKRLPEVGTGTAILIVVRGDGKGIY